MTSSLVFWFVVANASARVIYIVYRILPCFYSAFFIPGLPFLPPLILPRLRLACRDEGGAAVYLLGCMCCMLPYVHFVQL